MRFDWTVFVEGGDDKAFLNSLLNHLDIAHVRTDEVGGGVSKLSIIKPNISRTRDGGNQVAVILDADSDFAECRNCLLNVIDQYKLPIDSYFLLPDNRTAGCLESLLERMAVTRHRDIYHCFDRYEDCLNSSRHSYQFPNTKARIYAYCDALDIETRGTKRNYEDPSHWDLDVPELDPLKRFLRGLQSERP